MTIFAVVAITGHAHIDVAVPQQFPGRCHLVAQGHWLVSAAATSQEIATRVGLVPGGAPATGIVYGVVGYFGMANPQIWEWLASQTIASLAQQIPPPPKGLLGG